ncbi:MAG TPA: PHP domain-containing protein [Nitrospirae bacterium]|nr:error-prone DNA polymerase [bacterium BMS3Bbin09]HDH34859.1 PHP domain-containing protein [Nitrospirota bacterium]HDO67354.1 PHP domain-containing protein [Nitrospirota bacterium]HDZ84844.1 PHP domain-containing protein [Nitrospirota bacterium]HEW81528.1 PHP domain-containing protein [Nitrospirota bacterium]
MRSQKIIADLHNHSTESDGEYTPSELVMAANKLGLKAIALTDHDSIAGLDEAIETAQRSIITVIPGVEVSLRFRRPFFVGTLHLLLYFSESLLKDTGFRDDLKNIVSQGRGMALVRDRIDAINSEFGPDGREPLLSRPLSIDEITSQGDNITRRHFFMALSKNHNITDRSKTDRLIGNNSPAYIPSGIDMNLLKPLFAKYPIIKVLAHPAAGSFPGESHYKEVHPPVEIVEQLLPEFLDQNIVGIDGLEVYYPGHTEELENVLLSWVKRYDLLITGGSDCHDRKNRPLGVKGIDQSELDKLMERITYP